MEPRTETGLPLVKPRPGARVLIYSHDTFGLGHLRRSRALANAIVEAQPGTSVIIISGSPVIGNFEFESGVDYIRIPGVTKLHDGDYRSLNLNVSLDEAVGLRQALILQAAKAFQPDVFIVDKEPTGFRGEVVPALDYLQAAGCKLVLGIRDVMDEPALLVPEWERKGAKTALIRYYDEIWVYGLRDVYQPLKALDLPQEVESRITYTGYLRRDMPPTPSLTKYPKITKQPFILVTTGGGGDGDDLIDWVISAYEADAELDQPALILFGPFIDRDKRRSFVERIARQPKLDVMSFDKRTLIVPRTRPRLEQYIRAVEAERLGLVCMLSDYKEPRTPERMAAALRALSSQPRPSEVTIPGLLDGLDRVCERLKVLTESRPRFAPAYHQAAE